MFDGLYFEFPKIAFVVFFFVACETLCKMKTPSIFFPHTASFMKNSISSSKIFFFLKWISIVFLIVALMSPVKDEPYELEPKDGHEIALILDASESMQEQGFDTKNPTVTRFDVVKSIVSDFIETRENDNLGLVVFGEYSFIASPLTSDKNILRNILSKLKIGMAGKYTALYESLAQGVNLLKMTKSNSKVAILLTDGHSTQDVDNISLKVAIKLARREHIKVYPIGVGNSDGYDRGILLKIAKETDGTAFEASSASELKAVYHKIDALEKSKIKNRSVSCLKYYYQYPLFLGLLSLLFYTYLRNKRGNS